jgi:hypothetical protein
VIGENLKIIDRNGVGEWTGEQRVVTSSNEWGRGWQPKWKVYGEKKSNFEVIEGWDSRLLAAVGVEVE